MLLPTRSGGKTRLDAPGDWSTACALDTLTAIEGSPLVESITVLGDLKFDGNVVADLGTGLNNEIARAATSLPRPLVIVLGDLPAMTSEDFTAILEQATSVEKGVVIDHAGTGSTMITLTVDQFTPHFGDDSAEQHLADGYVPLAASIRARLDVDTYADLLMATELGLGVETDKLFKSKSPDL